MTQPVAVLLSRPGHENSKEKFVGIHTTMLPETIPLRRGYTELSARSFPELRYAYDNWFYSCFAPVNPANDNPWIPLTSGRSLRLVELAPAKERKTTVYTLEYAQAKKSWQFFQALRAISHALQDYIPLALPLLARTYFIEKWQFFEEFTRRPAAVARAFEIRERLVAYMCLTSYLVCRCTTVKDRELERPAWYTYLCDKAVVSRQFLEALWQTWVFDLSVPRVGAFVDITTRNDGDQDMATDWHDSLRYIIDFVPNLPLWLRYPDGDNLPRDAHALASRFLPSTVPRAAKTKKPWERHAVLVRNMSWDEWQAGLAEYTERRLVDETEQQRAEREKRETYFANNVPTSADKVSVFKWQMVYDDSGKWYAENVSFKKGRVAQLYEDTSRRQRHYSDVLKEIHVNLEMDVPPSPKDDPYEDEDDEYDAMWAPAPWVSPTQQTPSRGLDEVLNQFSNMGTIADSAASPDPIPDDDEPMHATPDAVRIAPPTPETDAPMIDAPDVIDLTREQRETVDLTAEDEVMDLTGDDVHVLNLTRDDIASRRGVVDNLPTSSSLVESMRHAPSEADTSRRSQSPHRDTLGSRSSRERRDRPNTASARRNDVQQASSSTAGRKTSSTAGQDLVRDMVSDVVVSDDTIDVIDSLQDFFHLRLGIMFPSTFTSFREEPTAHTDTKRTFVHPKQLDVALEDKNWWIVGDFLKLADSFNKLTLAQKNTLTEIWDVRTTTSSSTSAVVTARDALARLRETSGSSFTVLVQPIARQVAKIEQVPVVHWINGRKYESVQDKQTYKTVYDTLYKLVPDTQTAGDVSWDIWTESATTAVQVIRAGWGPRKIDVARELIRRGIAFHTLKFESNLVMRLLPVWTTRIGNGFLPPEEVPDVFDFKLYVLHCEMRFKRYPRMRAAALQGGIIGRLARQYLDLEDVLQGPSNDVTGQCALPFNGGHLVDDDLTEDEKDLLCGVYRIRNSAGSADASFSSWWPRQDTWVASSFYTGQWTRANEEWFCRRRDQLLRGDGDVKTTRQWVNALKGNKVWGRARDMLDKALQVVALEGTLAQGS